MLKPALAALLSEAATLIQRGEIRAAHSTVCVAHRIAEKDMTVSPHRLAAIREARTMLALA